MSNHSLTALNQAQQQAVRLINKPVLVLAGAGSGKTRVITHKINYLIRHCGYKAYHVVALTFTNKAAREMEERIAKSLRADERRGLRISTFHTLGLRILKEDGHYLGLRRDFSIFDQRDGLEILREITKNTDDKVLKVQQSQISNAKNDIAGRYPVDAALSVVQTTYNQHLKALNAVDFDDLILCCLELFLHHPAVLEKWQRRIRYLLVDEYQDTNVSQYHLIRCLINVSGHFTAVGDDDQSIYSWRGAESENLQRLAYDFHDLKVVKLEQNYRCDRKILSSSNRLIANNPHLFKKTLWSNVDRGEKITVKAYATDDDEARSVVTDLLLHQQRYQTSFNDYAILYRSNYQARVIEKHLRQQSVPYVINGATSFFEHAEVRDLLAYLRIIANPDDQCAFVRIINTPKREIGTATLQQLSAYAQSRDIGLLAASLEMGLASTSMSSKSRQRLYEFANWIMVLHEKAERGDKPTQLFDWVMADSAYEDHVRGKHSTGKADKRMLLLADLRTWIVRLQEKQENATLADTIQHMQLLDMLENEAENDSRREAVSMMTLHAAKGLEFACVFIVGLEEGLLPHSNCVDEEHLLEEERRLLYVGMTRAKYKLMMSLAKNRKFAGQMNAKEPSRFLAELPQDEIIWQGINEVELSADQEAEQKAAALNDLKMIIGDAWETCE